MKYSILFFVTWLSLIGYAQAQQKSTTITTYVVKTQEERKSTRFTLTEWLRIKERMKWMDLWLAMFSTPKEVFSPEFNIKYALLTGDVEGVDEGEQGAYSGSQMEVQLWLTNLVSSTTRMRTVNIDLGIEGRASQGSLVDSDVAVPLEEDINASRQSGMLALRLFGKNIQDSSLVLKGGKYSSRQGYHFKETDLLKGTHEGNLFGMDLQLYLFKWLGIEGNAYEYYPQTSEVNQYKGQYMDYSAYIEISLLRIMVGKYLERWQDDDSQELVVDNGLISGIQLQF